MEAAVSALRAIAAGERTDHAGGDVRSRGFVLRIPRQGVLQIVIAAQGPRMLRLAGAIADRVVVNLVTPQQAAGMASDVAEGAASAGRPTPPVAVWLAAGSVAASRQRVAEFLNGYIRAPGYAERFAEAGLAVDGGLVPSAVDQLAVFGDEGVVARRIGDYRAAGLAEVALVVSGKDPGGRTIINAAAAACRSWSGQ
jgi:alkanesulfonate monooxygenase SsuD/methylene tetrahydromethanopterin reductase-like flavin-dependent oxidoreductase (luciferase family)